MIFKHFQDIKDNQEKIIKKKKKRVLKLLQITYPNILMRYRPAWPKQIINTDPN